MKNMMLIYEAVEAKLGTDFENVFYQTMREDVERDVGIYLYQSSNDLVAISGEDIYDSIKVHVQVNCEKCTDGLFKALDYLSSFVDRIETEESDINGIQFISATHVGPRALPIGKNKHNIQICRAVIDLKYTFNN